MSLESILPRFSVMVALTSCVALAQTPAAAPAFEVAVIKPALPMAQALPLLMQGKMRAGIDIDQARVDMEFVTLTDLIGEAFKLRPHQIAGPDWLLQERFNIQAKLPDDATADQVPAMLRTLLAERFGMRAHLESRTLSAYALIVGKNGAKLKPSTLPPDPQPAQRLTTLSPSAGGQFTSSTGPAGPVQMTMRPSGIRLVLLRTNLSGLADMLTSLLGKPVVDRTGLKDYYEIALDVPSEDVQNIARALGMGGAAAVPDNAATPGGSSMFPAVEQLGLRLDSRKEQIETLVVDRIEKTPTAN